MVMATGWEGAAGGHLAIGGRARVREGVGAGWEGVGAKVGGGGGRVGGRGVSRQHESRPNGGRY